MMLSRLTDIVCFWVCAGRWVRLLELWIAQAPWNSPVCTWALPLLLEMSPCFMPWRCYTSQVHRQEMVDRSKAVLILVADLFVGIYLSDYKTKNTNKLWSSAFIIFKINVFVMKQVITSINNFCTKLIPILDRFLIKVSYSIIDTFINIYSGVSIFCE